MWRRTSASRVGRDAAILRVNDLAERESKCAPRNNFLNYNSMSQGDAAILRRVILSPRAQVHAWASRWTQLDIERYFKNLFEQLPLVHDGRRANAQASAGVQQYDLGGKFRRERELMRPEQN